MDQTAIILVNWNGWEDSIACIRSCLTLEGAPFRIILCDNDSHDGSVEKILAWARGEIDVPADPQSPVPVSTVRLPHGVALIDRASAEAGEDAGGAELIVVRTGGNLGFAGGNNVGLRWAVAQGCGFMWLLNNDTVVPPDALATMIDALRADPAAGICGSLMIEYDRPDRLQGFCGALNRKTLRGRHVGAELPIGHARELDPADMLTPDEVMYPIGASMLVTRAFVQTVGLMEESYFLYYEEADWVCRGLPGFRATFAHDSRVYHKLGASAGSTPEGTSASSVGFLYRSRLLFAQRFAPERVRWAILAMLLDATKGLIRGRTGRVLGIWRALTGRVRIPAPGAAETRREC